MPAPNEDPLEKEKFDRLSQSWWDPEGPLSSLHDIHEIRWQWIQTLEPTLQGKHVVDIGCGGGLLTETLAKVGAIVTGVDIAEEALEVAKAHALHSGLSITYKRTTAEELAQENQRFDMVTCMELLEHVPDYKSIVKACADLVKPGGRVFFSTINRTLRAHCLVVIAAEYCLKLLPKGTHDAKRFVRPSELEAACRAAGLTVTDITGFSYSPLSSPRAALRPNVSVNYMMAAQRHETSV